jgi:hypothetical protein
MSDPSAADEEGDFESSAAHENYRRKIQHTVQQWALRGAGWSSRMSALIDRSSGRLDSMRPILSNIMMLEKIASSSNPAVIFNDRMSRIRNQSTRQSLHMILSQPQMISISEKVGYAANKQACADLPHPHLPRARTTSPLRIHPTVRTCETDPPAPADATSPHADGPRPDAADARGEAPPDRSAHQIEPVQVNPRHQHSVPQAEGAQPGTNCDQSESALCRRDQIAPGEATSDRVSFHEEPLDGDVPHQQHRGEAAPIALVGARASATGGQSCAPESSRAPGPPGPVLAFQSSFSDPSAPAGRRRPDVRVDVSHSFDYEDARSYRSTDVGDVGGFSYVDVDFRSEADCHSVDEHSYLEYELATASYTPRRRAVLDAVAAASSSSSAAAAAAARLGDGMRLEPAASRAGMADEEGGAGDVPAGCSAALAARVGEWVRRSTCDFVGRELSRAQIILQLCSALVNGGRERECGTQLMILLRERVDDQRRMACFVDGEGLIIPGAARLVVAIEFETRHHVLARMLDEERTRLEWLWRTAIEPGLRAGTRRDAHEMNPLWLHHAEPNFLQAIRRHFADTCAMPMAMDWVCVVR